MSNDLIPNSVEWWENLFKSNWTQGIDGRKQTAYFMRLIIQHILPIEFYGHVLDFGCALGQGLYELRKHYPYLHLTGYDFAKRAIFEAKTIYPDFKFTSNLPDNKFDFVVCSNVLEHYKNPIPIFEQLLKLSKEWVVIMTPFDQETNDVHCCKIDRDTFPEKHMKFEKIKTVEIISEDNHLCGTTQILFVYRRCENA